MQKNVGTADRIFRVTFGIAFAAIGILKIFGSVWSILFGLLALEILLVALIGFSPLYALLGTSSVEPRISFRKVAAKWTTWDRDSEE